MVVEVLKSVLRVQAHVIVAKLCLLLGQVLDFLGDMAPNRGGDTREHVEAPWDAVSSLWEVLEGIEEEKWPSLLHDNTSPLPRASKVSSDLVQRGIGDVGRVVIPDCVWDATVPPSFSMTADLPGTNIKPMSTHAQDMLKAMRAANASLFQVSRSGRSPNGWAFVVPKNNLKCSWIFHLVQVNGRMRGKPPSFYLPTMEDMGYLMQTHCVLEEGGLYATHVDISNCYWGFVLPERFWDSFRFFDASVEGGGEVISILRLPFGWKYSPVLCQRVLQYFIKGLKKGQTLILHYLDDFMVLGKDKALVSEVTESLVILLEGKGCLISPKSMLKPVQRLAWLGKQFDFVTGSISNSGGAMAVAVAKWLVLATGICTRKRVQSAIGKMRWLARPHAFLSPVLAGPIAHSLWGPRFLPHTPIAILRGLATVLALSFKVWSPLRSIPLQPGSLSMFVFVDAARQYGKYAWGMFCESEGVRFGWFGLEVMSQMCAELCALCQAVRWAVHRGWKRLCLVGDNQSSLYQLLKVRAGVGFLTQQRILRKVSYLLSFSEIAVWLFWVPTHLMPADPISRYVEDFDCDLDRATIKAKQIFEDLEARDHLMVPYGRVNGLISPEERQAKKEELKRQWEEEQEESFMWWSLGGRG